MLHPSYSELMTKINEEASGKVVESRYSIVMGTAKRARQMVDKGYMELEDHTRKPLSIAVEELYTGDVRILTEEENREMRARFSNKMEAEALRMAAQERQQRQEEKTSLIFDDEEEDSSAETEDNEEAEEAEEEILPDMPEEESSEEAEDMPE